MKCLDHCRCLHDAKLSGLGTLHERNLIVANWTETCSCRRRMCELNKLCVKGDGRKYRRTNKHVRTLQCHSALLPVLSWLLFNSFVEMSVNDSITYLRRRIVCVFAHRVGSAVALYFARNVVLKC